MFKSDRNDGTVYMAMLLIYAAPVTKDVAALKTDSAVWAAQIVNILDNLSHVERLADRLKEDLRTDELTRQSYDNFYSECLGILSI